MPKAKTKLGKLLIARNICLPDPRPMGMVAFSRACDVSRMSLYDHLNGQHRMTIQNLKKIAAYLDVPIGDLID